MIEKQYILAIDQGTTSTRAIIFDSEGNEIKASQKELKLSYPQNGWVEQDPDDIWDDTVSVIKDVSKDTLSNIAAIGITNQRETTIIWDNKTGDPIYNAIVWQDRRTAKLCTKLKDAGHEDTIQNKTGLLLDPYFAATKIAWILDNVEGARDKANEGALSFGTVDSFLIWKLTDGECHYTDATNACRTMLFNIKTQEWDNELLSLFNIPKALLPEVKDNVDDFGKTFPSLLGEAIQIGGVAGDQHAAVIGQACFSEGMVKSTYGTGCFMLMNIGDAFKPSKHKLLTTLAYRIKGKPTYAIEGSIFIAGAAIQWLRDGLGLFDNAVESEGMAEQASTDHGVYFVPAFTGLGAPYWNPDARGAIFGLTRNSSAKDITRAALEAQAYQTRDLIDAIHQDSGFQPETIRADGGLVNNAFMCQFLSDILGVTVDIPKNTETTAQGAAYLAGLHVGFFKDFDNIKSKWQKNKSYKPSMNEDTRGNLYNGWKKAIKRVL